jgi:hypothetical protein
LKSETYPARFPTTPPSPSKLILANLEGDRRLLLFVIAVDTARNIVENLYFGVYFGSV